jgi:putative MFS transporter
MSDASAAAEAAAISARLDRLPATRYVWSLVLLLSLGGLFEFYDLFMTAYVAPGLIKSGIFTATTTSFFGFTGFASFVAAFFLGLFFGTILLGFVADRFGRKSIFTFSLLWYSVATIIMAFQNTADMLNLWRFIAGLGVGVELVTIDTYISELVPAHIRGRAFAINQTIQFAAVPIVAALGWWLVPQAPRRAPSSCGGSGCACRRARAGSRRMGGSRTLSARRRRWRRVCRPNSAHHCHRPGRRSRSFRAVALPRFGASPISTGRVC